MNKTSLLIITTATYGLAAASSLAREPEVRRAIPVHEPEVRKAIAVTQAERDIAQHEAARVKAAKAAALEAAAQKSAEQQRKFAARASTPTPTISESSHDSSGESVVNFVVFLFFAFIAALVFIWLLPGIIASKRQHPSAAAIWMITIFLGWSFFGWLAALVWAASAIERREIMVRSKPGTNGSNLPIPIQSYRS
jgi:hypothetical protein